MPALMPRPTRRTRAKHGGHKETVEERLLAAMERLLGMGQKFGTVTVEQLANEAGMSRATFYLHFSDKGELVSRLMSVVTDDIVRDAGGFLAFPEKPQRDDVEKSIRGAVIAFRKHRTVIAALNDTASSDPQVEALYMEMMRNICERTRHSLGVAKRDGLARPEADDAVADALSWFVVLYVGRFASVLGRTAFDRLTDAVVHISTTAMFEDLPGADAKAEAKLPKKKAASATPRTKKKIAPN